MMRLAASIAIGASVLASLLPIASWPASAQDVQAEAPVFAVGDWHLVRDDDGRTLLTVEALETDGARVTDTPEFGKPSIRYYDSQLNMTKREYETRTHFFAPSIMKYSFPLFVGKSWEGSIDIRSQGSDSLPDFAFERTYTCEVRCLESVEVPAGRFETFKTVCETRDSDNGDRARLSYWYSPTAGMSVWQVSEAFVPDKGWVDDAEQVLLDYSRAISVEFDVLPDSVESTCEQVISMDESTP